MTKNIVFQTGTYFSLIKQVTSGNNLQQSAHCQGNMITCVKHSYEYVIAGKGWYVEKIEELKLGARQQSLRTDRIHAPK